MFNKKDEITKIEKEIGLLEIDKQQKIALSKLMQYEGWKELKQVYFDHIESLKKIIFGVSMDQWQKEERTISYVLHEIQVIESIFTLDEKNDKMMREISDKVDEKKSRIRVLLDKLKTQGAERLRY